MTSIEFFNPEKHYEIVAKWWKAHEWRTLPPLHFLSKTGFLVSVGGVPAAAAWLFKTDSAICLLEWIIVNPDVRHEDRSNAISVLISGAKMMAISLGFQSIFMDVQKQSLGSRLEQQGFKAADKGMTHYFCDLTGGK